MIVRSTRRIAQGTRPAFPEWHDLWNTSPVIPALESLIALQALDSAAAAARERREAIPAEIEALDATVRDATAAVDAAQQRLTANQDARRELEKQVAAVDARLARSEDHKAAVKTNQEFTALLKEIETGKADKDSLEERILLIMEDADAINAELKTARQGVADAERDAQTVKRDLEAEMTSLDAELSRLADARATATEGLETSVLARYEQMLKARRGIAVARTSGETCSACFVRLRPHIMQQIRRNDALFQCESCQRILYYEPPDSGEASASA